jgi:NAD-dependent dihydropyrimidine dehydrogenase PreA subunit
MAHRIAVVVSQGQSHNPKKRAMEEEIVTNLLSERGIDVTVVPHLYDLKPEGTGMLCLSGVTGDLVVCSWLYPRAIRWILDRNDIWGHHGKTLLKSAGESEEEDQQVEDEQDLSENDKLRVLDERELPNRKIYCLDLRAYDSATPFLEEIRRIAADQTTNTVELMNWIEGQPKQQQLDRYLGPQPDSPAATPGPLQPTVVEEEASRRWYPVIDFSRCTNCLECIDFCLFGVYGIDRAETILVEQPDNCRKGCPACSRVCPENAIIFPQHKTPTIAGSPEFGAPMKIDLSKLFGAPDPGAPGAEKALDVAVSERDEQLLLAGRAPVGTEVGIRDQNAKRTRETSPRDELDELIDELDAIDL